ncbi:MAG: hypothetical protein IPM56_16215 [Ignavibacteriales bacterium]|nr:MAG: hypothetical protein IPM56_16215 [Ignavibacteriales bacterium]
MRFRDISGQDSITATVVNAMLETSNVLNNAEFYSIIGNADYTRKSASATGGRFRELNSDYPANQVDPQFANPTLTIFGDKVEVDRAHERRGSDIPSVRSSELLSFAKNLGKEFQNYFFNGDKAVDAKHFNGLKKIVVGNQKITPAADGIQVLLGNTNAAKESQQKFLENLDVLIQSVDGGAQAISMDGKTLSRLTRIAEGQVQWDVDEFGVPLPRYNRIPILVAGYNKSGGLILPHNEVCGNSVNCTSIYGYRFGEKSDLSFATNIGAEVKDLGLVGVHYTHSVDLDLDLVLLNAKSASRLEGIIIP